MNRYPLWKYATIAVALVIGILYTLPNFFPEVPAVQVSSAKTKIDTSVLAAVEEERLNRVKYAAGLPVRAIIHTDGTLRPVTE